MDIKHLENDLAGNAKRLHADLLHDVKAECDHIADPSQCGSIVRRHFNGLVGAIYLFIGLFLAAALIGIVLYTRR